jgi:hypothetical protein
MDDDSVLRASEAFLDATFGDGAGKKHTAYLEYIQSPGLREALHRYHAREADTAHLTLVENYLIGMCVLFAQRSWEPGCMFAKTLRHLGVSREKILEAVARMEMWVGGIPAAEATAHVQRALRDFDEQGAGALKAWFPERAPRAPGKEPKGG